MADMHDEPKVTSRPNLEPPQRTPLFFGFIGGNRLAQLRGAAQKMPLRTLALFSILWLLWTTGYTASVLFQNTTCWPAVCTSPHAAYLVPVFGVLLLPRKHWWFMAALFGGLFILGLANSIYVPAIHATAVKIFVVLMGLLTLGLGIGSGLLAQHFGQRYGRSDPRVTPDLLTIGTVFLTTVLNGPLLLFTGKVLAHGLHLPAEIMSTLGYGMELTAHIVQRSIRLALIGQMALVALCLPMTRQQKLLLLGVVPIFALLYWLQIAEHMLYPELEVTVLVLAFASLMPPGVTARAILFGAVPFAFTTGVFTMPSLIPHQGLATTEALSSVLMLVLAFNVAIRQVRSHEAQHRDEHLRRMEKIQGFADVGRFIVDFPRQEIVLDAAAQQIVSCPRVVGLLDFMNALRADSLSHLDMENPRSFESAVLHLAACDTRAAQDLKVYIWYEIQPGQTLIGHGFLLDVTREQEREAKLRFALKRLEEESQKQGRIFSVIGHELRAPVSVMAMLIDQMNRDGDWSTSGPAMKQACDQALETLGNMRLSIDPELNLPSRKLDLPPLHILQRLETMYAHAAQQAGMSLTIDQPNTAPVNLRLDETRIQQILGNLIRNAILHSGGRTIRLSVQLRPKDPALCNQDAVLWTVTDDGVGLSPVDAAALFEPFKRGERATVDGSGLGLYIAHNTATQLGGTLRVAPNQVTGTRFELHLPVTDPSPLGGNSIFR